MYYQNSEKYGWYRLVCFFKLGSVTILHKMPNLRVGMQNKFITRFVFIHVYMYMYVRICHHTCIRSYIHYLDY